MKSGKAVYLGGSAVDVEGIAHADSSYQDGESGDVGGSWSLAAAREGSGSIVGDHRLV
jgi:hypothetical protein